MKGAVILTLILSLPLFAGDKVSTPSASDQFNKIKTLAGTWGGTDDEGNTVTAIYRVVSDGSAVMETFSASSHPNSMITMYHLDKTKLMMTHYCSAGNQPRMRVKQASRDLNVITFNYVDATNLSSPKDPHMVRLTLTFKDDDHFSQQWTMSKDGKEEGRATFTYERVKQ